MIKAVRLVLALCAFAAIVAVGVGCGGVPGNAVAEVDGTSIDKDQFNHWMNVAAKQQGGQASATVPDSPDFKNCIAAKRKAEPKPAKGQAKATDEQLKAQCKTEYEGLRDQVMQLLTSFQWIQGEAEEQGVKVSDAEVKKTFEEQKKQSFPKDADYKKFLKDYDQTEADILARIKLDLLSNKIRDKIIKGKDKVSDAQIQDFYDKNKARFAQPERRDLRIVLTKGEAKANAGQGGARQRRRLEDGRQEVLDRRGLQGAGRQAARAGPGHAREVARRGGLQGQEGRGHRPGQDPVRLLRLRGREDHEGHAADARAGQGDDPPDAAVAEPAEGARQVRVRLPEEVEGEARSAARATMTQVCKGAKATPTPSAQQPGAQPTATPQQLGGGGTR